LFKKALKDNNDQWVVLLDYQNTPSDLLKSSPVQRLMSWRTRTMLPTLTSLIIGKVIEGVEEKIKQKKQKAKYWPAALVIKLLCK